MNSVYIHIPFCETICSYCDFTKFFYNEKLVDEYLYALEKEIKSIYKGDLIKTLYIGGGTPTCLNYQQLKKLLEITNIFNIDDTTEFTIETNVNLDIDKIKLLENYKVNRVSIGVQTLNNKHLMFLNRNHTKKDVINLIHNLNLYNIDNISVDLIYALKNQTILDIKDDLDFLTDLNIKHISTYSLIVENNTMLKINKFKPINEELDYEMYLFINKYLKQKKFINYEFSNYGLVNCFSKHNLVYWNNENYYGFGLSSGGYIGNVRYENNKNIREYIKGDYTKHKEYLTKEQEMENEMILGLRKIAGVSKERFYYKFNQHIKDTFDINNLFKEGKLIDNGEYIYINSNYLYRSNEILISFIDNFKKTGR